MRGDLTTALNPIPLYKQGGGEEKGEMARLSAFAGALAVGDLIKSTLGPKGMDKILQCNMSGGPDAGKLLVTNDGATILSKIGVDNPVAKVLVDISKVQDDEIGDGTTSVVVLASELLRETENLISQKIHPQIIISGWRKATQEAVRSLETVTKNNSLNVEQFKNDLMNIARTTLSSKILQGKKDYFAKLCVDAVLKLHGKTDLQSIQIIKRLGNNMSDSYLEEGFLLEKRIGINMPKRIENARILIANTPMDTDKIKIFGSRVRVDSVAKVAELELAEKEKMKDKVDKILKHGCNVFINRQLIYDYPDQLFAEKGVMAIEHADFEGVERLAQVLGGEIISTFDTPDKARLGKCKLIEEIMIGEDKVIKFSGVGQGEACTIVLRGATQQILDEAERSIHDVLCVLSQTVKEPRICYGGGAAEMLMANAVSQLAEKTPGKESIAIESFSRALRQLPTIIADNAGYDSSELISNLRAAHASNKSTFDMENGTIADMAQLGILESFHLKKQVVISAAEAAEMVLRIDNIIRAPPRPRQRDMRNH
ncbi:unnamed protein product [Rotaria magnacalcarata]|uniref:T-complex protein 1 subunit beta n=1 Tax=Rotaria magnacalcarata TaxID=392030 RepID=A0A819CTY9_9BILA|nr:unnamed protein product [Rotaria magnacalcarata]CAF3781122.1 unnamed protein product [Rotaria magnacalcarata]CAF3792923.1 unnamed protein product [Rotaria magnacalcarata]CAF3814799.1 unnamed protein product [Rotaria magnacalcarata]CAF3823429.1 unnamed protein product [Rotaria magnacalcarata]